MTVSLRGSLSGSGSHFGRLTGAEDQRTVFVGTGGEPVDKPVGDPRVKLLLGPEIRNPV